jgi:hypothetical protein
MSDGMALSEHELVANAIAARAAKVMCFMSATMICLRLTRYRRQNGVIKDAILASNPVAIFASGFHDGGPVVETLGAPPSSNKPKLLEQVREVIRRKHYSIRTEQAYCDWIKRFVRFHNLRHPRETGAAEIGQKLRATLKMNVASREPGLSQYVVKSTLLYVLI